jgi:hypothetical protein
VLAYSGDFTGITDWAKSTLGELDVLVSKTTVVVQQADNKQFQFTCSRALSFMSGNEVAVVTILVHQVQPASSAVDAADSPLVACDLCNAILARGYPCCHVLTVIKHSALWDSHDILGHESLNGPVARARELLRLEHLVAAPYTRAAYALLFSQWPSGPYPLHTLVPSSNHAVDGTLTFPIIKKAGRPRGKTKKKKKTKAHDRLRRFKSAAEREAGSSSGKQQQRKRQKTTTTTSGNSEQKQTGNSTLAAGGDSSWQEHTSVFQIPYAVAHKMDKAQLDAWAAAFVPIAFGKREDIVRGRLQAATPCAAFHFCMQVEPRLRYAAFRALEPLVQQFQQRQKQQRRRHKAEPTKLEQAFNLLKANVAGFTSNRTVGRWTEIKTAIGAFPLTLSLDHKRILVRERMLDDVLINAGQTLVKRMLDVELPKLELPKLNGNESKLNYASMSFESRYGMQRTTQTVEVAVQGMLAGSNSMAVMVEGNALQWKHMHRHLKSFQIHHCHDSLHWLSSGYNLEGKHRVVVMCSVQTTPKRINKFVEANLKHLYKDLQAELPKSEQGFWVYSTVCQSMPVSCGLWCLAFAEQVLMNRFALSELRQFDFDHDKKNSMYKQFLAMLEAQKMKPFTFKKKPGAKLTEKFFPWKDIAKLSVEKEDLIKHAKIGAAAQKANPLASFGARKKPIEVEPESD